MISIGASQLFVVAGNFTMSGNEFGVRRNVISVIIHQQFSAENYRNDVALLKVGGAGHKSCAQRLSALFCPTAG